MINNTTKAVYIDVILTTYRISNLGRLLNKRNREIKGTFKNNYIHVSLSYKKSRKYISIHRLVALMFITNLENKPYIDHIDSNTRNNKSANLQ